MSAMQQLRQRSRAPRRSGVVALSVLALLLAVDGAARPQEAAPGLSQHRKRGVVLHRRLPAPPGEEGTGPMFLYDPLRGGELPHEIRRDGQTLPAPAPDEDGRGETVYSPLGLFPADDAEKRDGPPEGPRGPGERETTDDPSAPVDPSAAPEGEVPEGAWYDPRTTVGDSAPPDRETEAEDRLDYHAVFDPSIVPFKRNRALDRVREDYTFYVEPSCVQQVSPAGNRVDSGREVFWGSLIVESGGREKIPIPSVGPDSRFLSYESVPRTTFRFCKDSADNLYATPATPGRYRLIFMMDAQSAYFGRPLPSVRADRAIPPALRPRVPASVAKAARTFARELGLEAEMPYDQVVGALVEYFRSFLPGEPPAATDDIYLDIARGKVGICRHRGFTFVTTMLGLGLPARFVFNEAHVFTEIWVPGKQAGWLRVDLGGGAERLVVHNAGDKVKHQPRGRDPFARPEPYRDEAAGGQLAGAMEVEGLPPVARPPEPGEAPSPGGPGANIDPRRVAQLLDARLGPPRSQPGLPDTRTTLTLDDSLVFRGEPLGVSGRVVDARGRGLHAGTVRIVLLDARTGERKALLGTTALGADGRYQTELAIPDDQAPGAYSVVAEFEGDSRHNGSSSE